MTHSTKSVDLTYAAQPDELQQRTDQVATEEPMEVRLRHQVDGQWTERSISITMRTPGDDHELAVGFLFTEGIVHEPGQIAYVDHCGPANADGLRNVVKVTLAEGVEVVRGVIEVRRLAGLEDRSRHG